MMADTTQQQQNGHGSRRGWLGEVVAGIQANRHAKVLCVGISNSGFPDRYRWHPQIVFWDGDTAVRGVVPAAVKLVLIGRFLQHKGTDRVVAHCRKHGIIYETGVSSGQLRQVLEPLVAQQEAPATEREGRALTSTMGGALTEALKAPRPPQPKQAAATTEKEDQVRQQEQPAEPAGTIGQRKGTVAEFVRQNARPDASRYKEARRLQKLAAEQGMDSPVNSFYSALGRMAGAEPKRSRPAEETAGQPVHALEALSAEDAELLRLVDDQIAAMQLIRDAIVRRGDRRRQLRELLKEL